MLRQNKNASVSSKELQGYSFRFHHVQLVCDPPQYVQDAKRPLLKRRGHVSIAQSLALLAAENIPVNRAETGSGADMAIKKVRCISNTNQSNALTLGKVYDILAERAGEYKVTNDTGGDYYYFQSRFEIVSEEIGSPASTIQTPTTSTCGLSQLEAAGICKKAYYGISCQCGKCPPEAPKMFVNPFGY